MKAVVSLPDDLFAAANALADRLGVSRDELYATAVAEYLAKHAASEVTERLDRMYGTETSILDPRFLSAQRRSLTHECW